MILDAAIDNFDYLLRATLSTVNLAVAALIPATIMGMLMVVAQMVGGRPVRFVIDLYLFFMRGIPAFVLVIFVYYLLPKAGIDLTPFWGVTLVLAAYYAAFMGEVFRAGVEALPRAQWEAARSLGMSFALTLEKVIFPQALRLAAPPFVNLCVSLVKATSLASVIGYRELTLASVEVVERTIAPIQVFASAALIYFVLCHSLSRLGRRLERRALAGY
jgi:polar amino acid transport system permease protein